MQTLKHTGLGLFLLALGSFIALLFLTQYEVSEASLARIRPVLAPDQQAGVLEKLEELKGKTYSFKFSYVAKVKKQIAAYNEEMAARWGLSQEALEEYVQAALQQAQTVEGQLAFTPEGREAVQNLLPEHLRQPALQKTAWMVEAGRRFRSQEDLANNLRREIAYVGSQAAAQKQVAAYQLKDYLFAIVKATSKGIFWRHPYLFFWLIIGLGALGALMYIYPKFFDGLPGIKHNGIFHRSATSVGLVGILTGAFLISFYILLYFYHYYIAEWIALVDPVSQWLRGEDASRWFMYGFLYTVAILVMGVRMFAKYRHSNYHKIRTASVMFFQTAFAFLIPQLLYQLNLPEQDLKNIWPLDYTFFFRIEEFTATQIGTFMLVWGIVLVLVGVPFLTYFFGKRWYCSWVCGCGGLAETLGDPYRQLSSKTLRSWKIERWLIHSVLVFAVLMTGLVLYTYFTQRATLLGLNSYDVRSVYGFAIGSVFAGVIGTGFYPLMGNRMWCRFGCPLAAYLGIVQRFKSRFRITTNGGQCISCGNCSTYCEMGIDVRWYAQRGQNIVRASCVGCGVCAAVCPRGVLALENGPNTGQSRMNEVYGPAFVDAGGEE
ncbi:MAG: 4Fe-4S binding protein [Bacteroidetes bacterium]|nr:MAG: 4Fe-4S binding protein [Bacteroidota bacterium]